MTYGVNAPLGFEPIGTMLGSPWNGATSTFTIASGYGTSIFSGDPIAMNNDGNIIIAVAGSTTNPMFGVFQGCSYVTAAGVITKSPYWPAGTAIQPNSIVQAFCIIDPNMLYSIQTNTAAGAILSQNFQNANFVAGTGNTQTGQSGYMLDLTNISPTITTYNCKILGSTITPTVSPFVPTNSWGVGYNNVIVKINNGALVSGTTGRPA